MVVITRSDEKSTEINEQTIETLNNPSDIEENFPYSPSYSNTLEV
jgi:hypothetical protein